MTVRAKHSKTSSVPDGSDSSIVQPSDWNADHAINMNGQGLVGRTATGDGPVSEITLSANFAFSGSQLTLQNVWTTSNALMQAAVDSDADTLTRPGEWAVRTTTGSNWPAIYATAVNLHTRGTYGIQIAASFGSGQGFWIRSKYDLGGFKNWCELWHSGNFTPTNYAPLSNPAFTGTVSNNGIIRTSGTGGGFFFNDRGTTREWAWYGTGGFARLYANDLGDVIVIESATSMKLGGYSVLHTQNFPRYADLNAGGRLGIAASMDHADWNNAVNTGWFMYPGGANAPSEAGSSWLMVQVTQHNTDWIQQEAFIFTNGPNTSRWRRHKNAGSWGSWVRVRESGYRVFVQSGDPGTASEDGDLWIW